MTDEHAAETPIGADDFPYKRLHGDMLGAIAQRFRDLMTYRPIFRPMTYRINNAPELAPQNLRFCFAGKCEPLIMVLRPEDYEKYNLISDYFIEQHRIRAYRTDTRDTPRESVLDYWRAHRDEIRKVFDKQTNAKDADQWVHFAREFVYHNKMEVGTFRPTVAAGIVWLMRATLCENDHACDWVLNPCAGWGDRLIGLMAAGVRGCVDVDPNEELGAEYPKICSWASSLIHSEAPFQHKYFPRPFEDIPISELENALTQMQAKSLRPHELIDRGFDLAIVDPPYFDLEVYVPNDVAKVQSITRYPTFDEWYNKFLIAMIKKCASLLRIGGILALIVNQASTNSKTSPNEKFLSYMVRDVMREMLKREVGQTESCAHTALRYLGVVSYAEVAGADGHFRARSPQPIWIWMRVQHDK